MRTPTILCALILAGCAVDKNPVATGGSRSDGIVNMGYDVGGFERPVVNTNTALAGAEQRCQAWGYTTAEPFGGQTQQCTGWYNGGCVSWHVNLAYQCTGAKAPA